MSKYTVELGKLIQSGYDIGLKDYPIPSFADESWRTALNNKIINHYYVDEIGCSAPDRFKLFLNNTMQEIMPVKNFMYEALHSGLVYNLGAMEEFGENTSDNSTGASTTEAKGSTNVTNSSYGVEVHSATPAAMLNVEDDIQSNTYADDATKNKGNGSSNETTTSNTSGNTTAQSAGERKYLRKWTGVPGRSAASLYKEYREAVNNIDMEIINELASCFMAIY